MRSWSVRITACLGWLALAAPQPASATDPGLRERVEMALSPIERLPSREELLRLSPRVEEVLREIVDQPSPRALARSRAISVLQLFPSEATRRSLRTVIRKSAGAPAGLPLVDLGRALQSYAVVTGPASVEVIRPFLTHSQVDVRYAAVRALGLTRSAQARSVLTERRKIEPSAMVRYQIERELKRSRALIRARPESR